MLANWNPDDLPASQKREGADWYAVFNPEVQRVLDVELVHHLVHDSVVCCVRFSRDGKYLATGCNRSAQIFDVNTGQNVATLQDESVDKDGDLYIRSVCFSPDGKYLATGAEDKQIRVSFQARERKRQEKKKTRKEKPWFNKFSRFGILLPVPSSTFSRDTSKTSTPSISPATDGTSRLVAVTRQFVCGIFSTASSCTLSALRMV